MIVFIGDVHGQFGMLNSLMNRIHQQRSKRELTFIQVGDNAYFWENDPEPQIKVPKNCKLIMIPGNHENWDRIDNFERGKLHQLQDRVFLAGFGAIEEIDDMKIMFCGGADSVDKKYRTTGLNWFSQEIITNSDMNYLYDNVPQQKIDILVSHTCGNKIFSDMNRNNISHFGSKFNDPSTLALDIIQETYNPGLCVFGHFHKFMEGSILGFKYVCVNMLGGWNGSCYWEL